jgi:purine-nucleoside/S-methyl-5'-thioadenosine phosphorylase / adenosine deaminase
VSSGLRWEEKDGVRWLGAELPGAVAAFSTRLGGVSEPPFDTLNLGRLTGDPEVRENRHRLCAALDIDPGGVLIGRQVHEALVRRHEEATVPSLFAEPAPGLPEADGQATDRPGLAPLVFVADCLPVALAGPRGVAMIHCGWRGMAAGIVHHGVEEVEATAAAVGPSIGPCCYEVGEEVLGAFGPLGDGIASGRMLDLREVVRRLLERAGVDQVEISDLCTSCNPDLFFSHRRDQGRTGRQAGLMWLTEGSSPGDTGRVAEDVAGVIR